MARNLATRHIGGKRSVEDARFADDVVAARIITVAFGGQEFLGESFRNDPEDFARERYGS